MSQFLRVNTVLFWLKTNALSVANDTAVENSDCLIGIHSLETGCIETAEIEYEHVLYSLFIKAFA